MSANIFNQGSSRAARGAQSRTIRNHNVAAWIENFRAAKREAARRYVAESETTNERRICTKQEFNDYLNAQIKETKLEWSFELRARLLNGEAINVGGVIFTIETMPDPEDEYPTGRSAFPLDNRKAA